MTQVPTPPASRHGSPSDPDLKPAASDTADLTQSLDDLLERYLHLLDQHQKLRSQMASSLSSGFLSLAHANYTCPPGRRYGEDYYDDRMKATRRMTIQPGCAATRTPETRDADPSVNPNTFQYTFNIESVTTEEPEDDPKSDGPSEKDDSAEDTSSSKDTTKDRSCVVSESSTPSETNESNEPASVSSSTSRPKSKTKPRSSDPLRWYGILVPPSLRSAQRSFTDAVEGHLAELASVVVEMQMAEKDIARVREELGQA
ncbi:hypothetical protein BDV59DRAFT_175906 [Aspergillus ambiguus]|uniref:uncharacterized protein n=1 Tax=Aspergillus ambiguus TaxID=176160 RepID=UPI003CCE24F3